MRAKKIFGFWAVGLLMVSFWVSTAVKAQTDPPIKIDLVADKISYLPTEPIQIQVVVSNTTTGDVIARKDWFDQDFYKMITFIDPDGIPITHKFARPQPEPGPPILYAGAEAVLVEIITPWPDSDYKNIFVMNDTGYYYNLTKYGRYNGRVNASLETFSQYITDDNTGELFSYLADPGREVFNPLVSNQISFEIVSPEPLVESSVSVYIDLLKLDGSNSHPGATRRPLERAKVHLVRKSDIPEDYLPVNWKVYGQIWTVDPAYDALTGPNGIANFYNIKQDDYVVLATHYEFSDVKHMGSPLGADDSCWQTAEPCEKHLKVMLKADGKKVAGKTTKMKGSLLLLTEPEYVEWGSTQELYPFVFETIGDWEVSTSVEPPEGFETDYKELDAQVIDEMEAVQFTVTDVGSSWKETKVKYKINHKKKTETFESEIGIKLSEKLAKQKKKGIYGDTEDPGPFKGGKKVKYSDKDK